MIEDENGLDWPTISRIFGRIVSGGLVLRWEGEDVYSFVHDDNFFGFTKFELRKLEQEHNVKLQFIY